MKLEYPLIEEITKHKTSKIIYVITHSESNINNRKKRIIFERINFGIGSIAKISEEIEKFKADNNNVVFVNFHKDIMMQEEPFGTEELFNKIYDVFIQSEDYIRSLEELTEENIEKTALKLRAQAQEELLSNKILGAAVGVIPFVDLALQKFVIKKNAVKKVGEIFGIDVTFIDEENANNARLLMEAGAQASGGISLASASASAIEAANFASKATELGAKAAQLTAKAADLTAKATQLGTAAASEAQNMNALVKVWYSVSGTTTTLTKAASSAAIEAANAGKIAASASQSATAAAQSAAVASSSTTLCRVLGVGFMGLGIALGVGLGGYFTHKFCEELLDKFVDYYKNNANRLVNSYRKAAEYFEN